MKFSIATLSTAVVLAAAAMHSTNADAIEAGNATGMCQGALPVYDTEIRKRPTAVRNEGTAAAYVSCSFPVNYAGDNTTVIAYVVNSTAADVDMTCTLVDGVAPALGAPGATYYPLSITVPAGMPAAFNWLAGDFGLPSFTNVANLSCALPPGVEIALLGAIE